MPEHEVRRPMPEEEWERAQRAGAAVQPGAARRPLFLPRKNLRAARSGAWGPPSLPGGKETGRRGYAKYCPPFTLRVAPVMKPASSLDRKATQRATSSGLPMRPTGMPPTIFCSTSAGIWAVMAVSM